jgi:hypothetical protein
MGGLEETVPEIWKPLVIDGMLRADLLDAMDYMTNGSQEDNAFWWSTGFVHGDLSAKLPCVWDEECINLRARITKEIFFIRM